MQGMILVLMSVSSILELYPAPQSAFMQEKKQFAIPSILPIVMQDAEITNDTIPYLSPLYNALGYEPTLVQASMFDLDTEAIYIGITAPGSFWEHRSLRKYVPEQNVGNGETYRLTINGGGIFLAATDQAGLLHGIYTLAQIVRSSASAGLNRNGIPAIPHVEIEDYPDLNMRAAYLKGPVSSVQLQAFAALKCNMIIFESNDFYDLQGDSLTLWQNIFREAKTAGITPVPLFQLLKVPSSFIKKNPLAVEGRSRIDRIKLNGDDFAALSKRNLIITQENPVRVAIGEKHMQHRQDYMISGGETEFPFEEAFAHPWLIRRIPGGAIPDGATVTLTYSYAPPYSDALCPHAMETRTMVRNALQSLIQGLQPSFIHCGGADITRLNQDLRCRNTGKKHSETFLDSVMLLHELLAELGKNTRMMLWTDALLPPAQPTRTDLDSSIHPALSSIPPDILLVTGFDANECVAGGKSDTILQWLSSKRLPAIACVDAAAPAAVYRTITTSVNTQTTMKGIIIRDANPLDEQTRALFGKAWSQSSCQLPWPEGLNDFFGSALWNPDATGIKDVITRFLDSKTLAGQAPSTLRERFDVFLKERRGRLSPEDASVAYAAALFDKLTRYLELEYEYARGKERDALSGMEKLLRNYCDVDKEMDEERLERIVTTIKQQNLFPPVPILVGRPMACYRPVTLPAGINLYETPVQITYADERGSTEATFDFLTDCGGVYRIDFETVNASGILLRASKDGKKYEPVPIYSNLQNQTKNSSSFSSSGKTNKEPGETLMRGPVFPAVPLRTRYLKLRVESQGEQAVLREVRAFSWKTSPRVNVPPLKNETSDTAEWPDLWGVTGFLHLDGTRMAAAPTAINLARTKTHLFIGIMAEDPMPHATGASITKRDAPLWEEESVEVRIRPAGQPARRFLVNPLGTQHDAMVVAENMDCWDAGWDADWRVQTENTETGWTATIMLPFSILGGTPEKRTEWDVNFIRHRNNVEKEKSAWAISSISDVTSYGALVFE